MSDPFKKHAIPKAALVGAAFLVGLSLVVTTAHVTVGFGAGVHGPGDVVFERSLVFADEATGGVRVIDGNSGDLIRSYEPGTGQFIRNMVRLMARDRMKVGGSSETPFLLVMRAGGYLSLVDPVTDRSIELNAFGSDNLQAFAALLPPRETIT